MLSGELKNIRETIGTILGKVDPENAELLRQCRRNLEAVEEQAENLEKSLVFVDLAIEEVSIPLPHPQIAITAKEIKVSGFLPAKEVRRTI